MRHWRPLTLVLALLSGCSKPGHRPPPPPEEPPPAPCARTALRVGPAPSQDDTGMLEQAPGDRALFFIAEPGTALWTSTGSRKPGCCAVRDFPPGPTAMGPTELTRVGDTGFFAAEDPEHGRELWVSDGTAEGMRMVKDLWPGTTGSEPQSLFESGGRLYFAASDPEHGRELWRSDGTPEGTVLLQDLDPGAEGASPDRMTRGGEGALYFVAHFQGLTTALMRSHGGSQAFELTRVPAEGGILEPLPPAGRRLFFVMGHLHDPRVHLMVTEGATPALVGEFAQVHGAAALGGQLYFSATTGDAGTDTELWRSDGTPDGTQRVKDIQPGEAGSRPEELTVLGSRLFFTADDGMHGRELWVSDGTDAGTHLFVDLAPGADSAAPEALAALQGHLFFSAETPGHGREPWMSGGTPKGTVALDELAPGDRASDPKGFVLAAGEVFFTAGDGTGTRALWALPMRPEGPCGTPPK